MSGAWGELKELLLLFKDHGASVILTIVIVVLGSALVALIAYKMYLVSPERDYSPPTHPNKQMTARQFELHKKDNTKKQIAKLMASKEYNDYLNKKQLLRTRNMKEQLDDEIVFSDEEREQVRQSNQSLTKTKQF